MITIRLRYLGYILLLYRYFFPIVSSSLALTKFINAVAKTLQISKEGCVRVYGYAVSRYFWCVFFSFIYAVLRSSGLRFLFIFGRGEKRFSTVKFLSFCFAQYLYISDLNKF